MATPVPINNTTAVAIPAWCATKLNEARTPAFQIRTGVQDQYINECRKLLAPLHQDAIAEVNTVAYRTTRVLWVHVPHPSGVNIRHFNNWVSQPNNQPPMGTKRADAIDAIRRFGGLH